MALHELVVDDDLDIDVSPEGYIDQANPKPPLPGIYRFQPVGKLVQRMNADGKPQLTDGKFPSYTIMRAKIVEPDDCAEEFGLFHDIRTKPFERQGHAASDVADICRAIDQTVQPESYDYKGWLDLLQELLGSGGQFVAELGWSAYDAQYVEQEFELRGVTKANAKDKLTKEVLKEIYKKAKLFTSAFKADGKGSRLSLAIGPSGSSFEAKPRIEKFIPSLQPVNLGRKKIK